ncbi:hypothetical protein EXU85_14095 [Spirosoma sp. KCTC 42546]|uniref:hypothetical protein n=1 Tax=Spirosoma sp. KCTC 42546 TaxID=2520506 RepID=UPI0011573F2B|nr:hypothetical protein [Spirosoma sp. KCTC 42546]QDK79675.1 hypothetical protein EXU85_14095 [Spirosoma sp. KCTC 42546]
MLAFILALARYNQKAKQLQVAKQDLPRSATLVSRLCEDSTALKNTINTAMATITINYAKQAKTLQADSIHAASLSDDQLDAETTVFSQPTDSLSKRQRKEEINRQLTDYGRVMLDNEKLVTKSGFCDALVKDVREALLALVGWFPINRLKRGRAKKCSSELKEIPS